MKSFGKFISGFFFGGLLISLVVLLFTPVSGAEMRMRIDDNFHNIRDEVKAASKQKSEELRQELARLQKKTSL